MNFEDKKSVGPGKRTLAQLLYEPRSDRPSVEDFTETLGEPEGASVAAGEFAHKLLEILSSDTTLTPGVVLYGLAHAWADVALAIGGEMQLKTPDEMIAEVGFPALFSGIPFEHFLQIVAGGTRAVMRLHGTSPAQEIAAMREARGFDEQRDTISDPFPAGEAN